MVVGPWMDGISGVRKRVPGMKLIPSLTKRLIRSAGRGRGTLAFGNRLLTRAAQNAFPSRDREGAVYVNFRH
jgi:hypothetical protein